MIELKKAVRRWARGSFRGMAYSVSMLPGDVLEFREKTRRKSFLIGMEEVMTIAVKRTVAEEQRQKRAARSLGRPTR